MAQFKRPNISLGIFTDMEKVKQIAQLFWSSKINIVACKNKTRKKHDDICRNRRFFHVCSMGINTKLAGQQEKEIQTQVWGNTCAGPNQGQI